MRSVICQNGKKVEIQNIEGGYKVNGMFIKKIRTVTEWRCNFRNETRYTKSTKWGYSENAKSIENDNCNIADTLKEAVSYCTGNYSLQF